MVYLDKMDDGSGSYRRIRKDSFFWYQEVIAQDGFLEGGQHE